VCSTVLKSPNSRLLLSRFLKCIISCAGGAFLVLPDILYALVAASEKRGVRVEKEATFGTSVVVVGCMRRVMRREADVRCAGLNIEEFHNDM
jgi:hypothetical protein